MNPGKAIKKLGSTDLLYYLVLFLTHQIIYFPLSFTPFSKNYSMKGDFLEFHYLINLFNSDAYRYGEIPLWNPYLFSGIPWAASLETKVFYPIQMLLSLTIGYSYELLQAEFMLTVFLGGAGLFALLRNMKLSHMASYFGSLSYISSGIFVGNAEHFGQIIVYSFSPWIFLMLYKLYLTNNTKYALMGSVLLAATVLGGYPGTYIVLSYLLLFFSAIILIKRQDLKKTFLNLALFGVFALGLSSILIIPAYELFGFIIRSQRLSYELAVSYHSLEPINLLSAIFPSPATNKEFLRFFQKTDISMTNIYAGCLIWFFISIAIFRSRGNRLLWIILSLSLICFAASMGDKTFIRPFTYYYLPLMDKVRLNSPIFRGYALLAWCIVAAFGVDRFLGGKGVLKKSWILLFWPMIIFIMVQIFPVNALLRAILLKDLIFISLFIVSYVSLFLLYSKGWINYRILTLFFCLFLVAEFSYAVRTNSVTLWSNNPQLKSELSIFEKKRDKYFTKLGTVNRIHIYPIPDNWVSLFNKIPADGGFISGLNDAQLTSYFRFMNTNASKDLYFLLSKNKAVFADTVTYYKDENQLLAYLDNPEAFHVKNVYVEVKERNSGLVGKTLSFWDSSTNDLKINKYTLNSIEFSYETAQDGFVIFNDVYYPGWRAYSKQTKKEIEIIKTNLTFRGMFLPAGSDTIVMEFSPVSYKIGKGITIFSVISIIMIVVFNKVLAHKKEKP
jgi:hypothetical protein